MKQIQCEQSKRQSFVLSGQVVLQPLGDWVGIYILARGLQKAQELCE
jgi:hypothetical protein